MALAAALHVVAAPAHGQMAPISDGRQPADRAQPAELTIVGPTRANLNQEASLELAVVSSNPDSAFASTPSLFANVGEIRNLRPQGGGRWLFEYVLPRAKYPQVALLAAAAGQGRRPATHRIELTGNPTIEIQSKPRVVVQVQAGGRSFGPAVTDASGQSRLEVLVPPGLDEITTLATDSYGNVTEGTLRLETPAFSRLLAVCAPDDSALYVLALDEHGTPAETSDFSVDAASLNALPATLLEPGLFRIAVSPAPGSTWEAEHHLRVSLAGQEQECSLRFALPRTISTTAEWTPAVAHKPRPLLGGRLGATSNFARVAGPWAAVHLAVPFSTGSAQFRLAAEVAYTRCSRGARTDATGPLELTIESWPTAAGVEYLLSTGRWRWGAAVTSGIALVSVRVKQESSNDVRWAHPLLLGGALEGALSLPQGEGSLELGYTHASVDTGSVHGNAGGWRAALGYLFQL